MRLLENPLVSAAILPGLDHNIPDFTPVNCNPDELIAIGPEDKLEAPLSEHADAIETENAQVLSSGGE